MEDKIRSILDESIRVKEAIKELAPQIRKISEEIIEAYQNKKKVVLESSSSTREDKNSKLKNMPELKTFMHMAIEEAKISLREGNCGFGAVIIKGDTLIAKAHDTEKTFGDATAHAEMTAIQLASAELGT